MFGGAPQGNGQNEDGFYELQATEVRIYKPDGSELATVTTDADGFYLYAYKHTARAATYTLRLLDYYPGVPDQSVTIRANGFAVVNFTVS